MARRYVGLRDVGERGPAHRAQPIDEARTVRQQVEAMAQVDVVPVEDERLAEVRAEHDSIGRR